MKHFLLLLLRNAKKHNSIKFSAARLHVSTDNFWNCLKNFQCNNVKTSFFVGEQADFISIKLKKNFCKTLYRLKM